MASRVRLPIGEAGDYEFQVPFFLLNDHGKSTGSHLTFHRHTYSSARYSLLCNMWSQAYACLHFHSGKQSHLCYAVLLPNRKQIKGSILGPQLNNYSIGSVLCEPKYNAMYWTRRHTAMMQHREHSASVKEQPFKIAGVSHIQQAKFYELSR